MNMKCITGFFKKLFKLYIEFNKEQARIYILMYSLNLDDTELKNEKNDNINEIKGDEVI